MVGKTNINTWTVSEFNKLNMTYLHFRTLTYRCFAYNIMLWCPKSHQLKNQMNKIIITFKKMFSKS